MSALHREWINDQARRTIVAPEMRPVGQVPCVPTSTGVLIGCAYRRPMPELSADAERLQAALLSKPRRARTMARLLLGLLGSTRAVLWLIAIAATALLLTACGPSDTEALQDTAADLRDAQQQARAEWRAELKHAQALAMLAARIHK